MMYKRLERDLGLSAGRIEKQISLAHLEIVCLILFAFWKDVHKLYNHLLGYCDQKAENLSE